MNFGKEFIKKVMSAVEGSTEDKLDRFGRKLSKYYEEQISARKKQIEQLEEKKADLNESLEDTILAIDVAQLNKIESTLTYCATYSKNVAQAKKEVDDISDRIEVLEKEIEQLEELSTLIFGKEA